MTSVFFFFFFNEIKVRHKQDAEIHSPVLCQDFGLHLRSDSALAHLGENEKLAKAVWEFHQAGLGLKRLTSTMTTSIFTFGGRLSSGWKAFAMATSR